MDRPELVIHGGHVYGLFGKDRISSSQKTLCIDLATGKAVATIPMSFKNLWGYIPMAAEGRLLFGSECGPSMLNLDPEDFRYCNVNRALTGPGQINGSKLPRLSYTGCVYADGFLFYRGETATGAHLYCYDLRAESGESTPAKP
jgi:hypothetical protein